jgi:CheY-like chemotaxis protein
MDGMETVAKIHEKEKFTRKHLPVIAMTAHGNYNSALVLSRKKP